MKNIILIFLLFVTLFSCRKNENNTNQTQVFVNSSSNKITVYNYDYNYFSILPNQSKTLSRSYRGQVNKFRVDRVIGENDSVEVIYNDTLSIFHGSNIYSVSRDIRKYKHYKYEDKQDGNYKTHTYTYTFTNADFDEARLK